MGSKTGGRGEKDRTKIRFIMFEAEGDAADLQQFAQAIANSVRPASIQIPVNNNATPQIKSAVSKENEQSNSLPFMREEEVEDISPVETKRPATTNSKKKYISNPTILEGLDLSSGPTPFVKYHQEKNPTNHNKRYLVIAAWLKEFRGVNEISIDHIYTCYRILKLNVVADVGGPFRSCKSQGWFSQGSQRGWYSINHVGLNEVNTLNNGE